MYRKSSYGYFIKDNNGAAIVEFAFVFLIIILFMKTLIAVAQHQSTVGKLDRISYSISGIIRERERLYNNSNLLTQNNVNELASLANSLLSNSTVSAEGLAMTIETLHFNPTNSASPEDRVIDNNKSLEFSVGTCQPVIPIRKMPDLSPYSTRGRWIPLYQVTLCLPSPAWYQSLFSQEETTPVITSSAVTFERSFVSNTDTTAQQ